MGRPRKGTEPRQQITLRLDPDTIVELNRRAATLGVTRTELIERAVVALCTGSGVVTFPSLSDPPSPEDEYISSSANISSSAIVEWGKNRDRDNACVHPAADRQTHSWGSTCGRCGKRR